MKDDPRAALRATTWGATASLLMSGSTLICCTLPALLVAIGAGASLAGLVSAVPQLVWLPAHKGLVFGGAGGALAIAGILQWRARSLPCPADPTLAAACARTRRASAAIYWTSVAIFAIGVVFAFVLPGVVA